MNFGRFSEQLESFLALEQRGRWSAVGLVDITGFKWYNDALGHAVGDRIIERVATDPPRAGARRRRRRAGDAPWRIRCTRGSAGTSSASSCRHSPNATRRTRSPNAFARRSNATTGRRSTRGSRRSRFASTSAWCACGLGRIENRRANARQLAAALIQRADELMYEAKSERANHIYLVRAKIQDGELEELTDGESTLE